MKTFWVILIIIAGYVVVETYQGYEKVDHSWTPSQEALDKINEMSAAIDKQLEDISR